MLGSILGLLGLVVAAATGAYSIRDIQNRNRATRADESRRQEDRKVQEAVKDALEKARVDGIEAQLRKLQSRDDPK